MSIMDFVCCGAGAVGLLFYATLLIPDGLRNRDRLWGASFIFGLHLICAGRVFHWW